MVVLRLPMIEEHLFLYWKYMPLIPNLINIKCNPNSYSRYTSPQCKIWIVSTSKIVLCVVNDTQFGSRLDTPLKYIVFTAQPKRNFHPKFQTEDIDLTHSKSFYLIFFLSRTRFCVPLSLSSRCWFIGRLWSVPSLHIVFQLLSDPWLS